jgi:hypothetical protein
MIEGQNGGVGEGRVISKGVSGMDINLRRSGRIRVRVAPKAQLLLHFFLALPPLLEADPC